MAMHKAIKSRKEHRKEYVGKDYCKSVDTHCQNNGGRHHSWQCPWCLGNRINKNKNMDRLAKKEIRDFYK